jgi:chemotaxis protein methyltransferase CheR
MAILLNEEGLGERTRIYATDMSESAILAAKQGKVRLDKMQTYTKNYILSGGKQAFSEYYLTKDNEAIFHKSLLERVVFAQHNLATDQSFNEFHVIVCRNVMIYFNQALQNHAHSLFYESLSSNGILALGNKESLITTAYNNHYEEVDRLERIYRKKEGFHC